MIRPLIITHCFFPILVIRSHLPALFTRCSASMFPLWSATLGLSRVNISRPSFFSWPAWRFFSQSHVQYAGPEDPIARRKWQDKRNEAQRVRYHANLEDSRKRSRLWWERQREQNPVYYEAYQKRNNLLKVRIQANDPRYGFVKKLHGWCVSHDWVREELPWETHLPVLYPEKVHKQCSGCDHLKPGGGVRLWFEKPC